VKLGAGTDSGEADQENGGGAARFRRRDGGAWTARAGGRAGRWRRVAAPLPTRVGRLARASQGEPNPGFAGEMAAGKWRRRRQTAAVAADGGGGGGGRRRMTPALMPT